MRLLWFLIISLYICSYMLINYFFFFWSGNIIQWSVQNITNKYVKFLENSLLWNHISRYLLSLNYVVKLKRHDLHLFHLQGSDHYYEIVERIGEKIEIPSRIFDRDDAKKSIRVSICYWFRNIVLKDSHTYPNS